MELLGVDSNWKEKTMDDWVWDGMILRGLETREENENMEMHNIL